MPKFTIDYSSKKNPEEAYKAMKDLISGRDELQKFDSKATMDFNDGQKTCQIKGSQFSAEMNVHPASEGSRISVDVDLSFLLTPFKGKVEEMLTKMLAKHVG